MGFSQEEPEAVYVCSTVHVPGLENSSCLSTDQPIYGNSLQYVCATKKSNGIKGIKNEANAQATKKQQLDHSPGPSSQNSQIRFGMFRIR